MNYPEHIIRLQTEVNRTFGRTVTSMFDFELLAENTPLYPNATPLLWQNR